MNYKIIPLTAVILFVLYFIYSPDVYSNPSDIIAADYDTVITFDSIKNELSEDGEWIKIKPDEIDAESVEGEEKEFDDAINTDYVWRPNNVDENWSPYSNGYWRYTNCGWMWFSNYHWGWRPFHYGRWWWSPVYGWVWSPGYVWAPAWVVWMFYGDYYGWYPLSPRTRWHRHHGYRCHNVRFRVKHWKFVEKHKFLHLIDDTEMGKPNNKDLLKNAEFIENIELENGRVINKGPNVKDIENSTGKKIETEEVNNYNTKKAVNEIIENEKKRNPDAEKKVTQEKKYRSDEKQVKKDQERSGRDEEKVPNPYWNNDNEKNKEVEKKKEPEKRNDNEKREPEKKKEPERKIENRENNNNNNQNNNNTNKPKDVNQPDRKPVQDN